MGRQTAAQGEVFSGWKDVANYLGKSVRTVQRYERELGLPIRRPVANATITVIATKAELDAWISASPVRRSEVTGNHSGMLKEFRPHMKELHLLRHETAQLRQAVNASLALLRMNLQLAMSRNGRIQQPSSERRGLAEVLSFKSDGLGAKSKRKKVD
jgi:hypothetical protein